MVKIENLLTLLCNLQDFQFETQIQDFDYYFLNEGLTQNKLLFYTYNHKSDKNILLNFLINKFLKQQNGLSNLLQNRDEFTKAEILYIDASQDIDLQQQNIHYIRVNDQMKMLSAVKAIQYYLSIKNSLNTYSFQDEVDQKKTMNSQQIMWQFLMKIQKEERVSMMIFQRSYYKNYELIQIKENQIYIQNQDKLDVKCWKVILLRDDLFKQYDFGLNDKLQFAVIFEDNLSYLLIYCIQEDVFKILKKQQLIDL